MSDLPPPAAPNPPYAIKLPIRPPLLRFLGPGLITAASDDDPSG